MTDATDTAAYRVFAVRFARQQRVRRTETLLGMALLALLIVVAAIDTEFYPTRIIAGLPRIGDYFGKLFSIVPTRGAQPVPVLAFAHLFGGVKEPQSLAYWFYRFGTYETLLWQTIQMAVVGTVMGFTGGFVLSFPAARNLLGNGPVLWLTRRLLEVMRSIPQVVLAFILVWPFGIGPRAGIIAIGIHSTGALGKLFSEVNENADMRPVEGMRAAGGNWLEAMRYGVVPQVLRHQTAGVFRRPGAERRADRLVLGVGACEIPRVRTNRGVELQVRDAGRRALHLPVYVAHHARGDRVLEAERLAERDDRLADH